MIRKIKNTIIVSLGFMLAVVTCSGFELSQGGVPRTTPCTTSRIEVSTCVVNAALESGMTKTSTKNVRRIKKKKKRTYYTKIRKGRITKASLKSICKYVGKKYDIDGTLLQAIVAVESDRKVYCTGTSGDKGLCQIVERFHKARMKKLKITDIYDPYSNILLCADFLTELKSSKYGDDIYFVLMAYNMGLGNATKNYESGRISQYVYKVMKKYKKLKGDD